MSGRPLIEFLGIPQEEDVMLKHGWHEPHSLDAREIDSPVGVLSAPIALQASREIDHGEAEVDESYLDVMAAVPDPGPDPEPQPEPEPTPDPEGNEEGEGDGEPSPEPTAAGRRTSRRRAAVSW